MKLPKLIFGITLLAYCLIVHATQENNIKQSSGYCSPNTVTTNGVSYIFNTCVLYPENLKLNKLQLAQYQLILAQNRTNVLVQNFFLTPQIGESNFSLWANISNRSQFDVAKVDIKPIEPNIKTSKIKLPYTYISNELPDSIIQSSSIKLSNNSNIKLKVADGEKLKSKMPEPFSNWCLYDVGDRALDVDSEGYQEAVVNFLKLYPENNQNNTKSIPIAFEVTYKDLFNRITTFAVVKYLRFADISNSQYIFYPSKQRYEKLSCLEL